MNPCTNLRGKSLDERITKRLGTLPKRCKFFAACGQAPIRIAKHSYLGNIAICDKCYQSNPYIEFAEGDL